MATPGFSITELLQAIDKCREIYNAFTDEYSNAPACIKELGKTCKYLHDVLVDFKSVLGDDPYPHENTFIAKLNECEAFIQKYKRLKQEYQQSHTITDQAKRAWQTTKYVFDEKKATDLKNALSLEIQKLALFILVFGVRRNHAAINQTTYNASSELDSLLIRFQAIRYQYDRAMSMFAQHGVREPNLIAFGDELEGVWRDLCSRVGPQLPLPVDRERLLTTPYRNMNNVIIGLPRNSINAVFTPLPILPEAPAQPETHRPEPSPMSSPSLSPLTDGFSGRSTLEVGATPSISELTSPSLISRSSRAPSSIHLPPPAGFVATFALQGFKIRLGNWQCATSGDSGRKIVWTAESPRGQLEHALPRRVFPDTLHRKQAARHKMFVSFQSQQLHEVIWTGEDGSSRNYRLIPHYYFNNYESRKEFQSDVRDKDLVATFDTEDI